jgi:hypothetical protein
MVALSCVVAFGENLLRYGNDTTKDFSVRDSIKEFYKEMGNAKVDSVWVSNDSKSRECILEEVRHALSHGLSLPHDVVLLPSFEYPLPKDRGNAAIIVPKKLVGAVRDTVEVVCKRLSGSKVETARGDRGLVEVWTESGFTTGGTGAG